jgi:hypothetical protein
MIKPAPMAGEVGCNSVVVVGGVDKQRVGARKDIVAHDRSCDGVRIDGTDDDIVLEINATSHH